MTSRHKRPNQPRPFQLTTRDLDVLVSVYRHRFLSALHVHQRHFYPASVRSAQVRLQRMWAGNLLDRLYLPEETPGVRDRWCTEPVYSLAPGGADVVAERLGLTVDNIPHTAAQNREGYTTLRHHLVFTDIAVALESFSVHTSPWSATTTRESTLRSTLQKRNLTIAAARYAIVPDGAVTLSHPDFAMPQTLLVEVVRAGAKSGNQSVRRKLRRYRAAVREGFFRNCYGFNWIRHVVFLAPTVPRARNLAALARDIPGAELLFRFGAYEDRVGATTPRSAVRPETVATEILFTPGGGRVSFLPPFSNPIS